MNRTTDYLRENIAELAVELLGEPTRKAGREWRWRGKGALAVVVTGDKQGAWRDHESDEGGGPVDLIARALRLDREGTVAWAREWVDRRTGGSLSSWTPPPRPAPESKPEDHGKIDKAWKLWAESVEIAGTDGARYLAGRGITSGIDRVRFLPSFWYGPGKSLPAIIIRAESGAVQVIVIENGRKAAIDTPKRTYGSLAGTGVELQIGGPADPVILVEGPETGLSLVTASVPGTILAVLSVSNFAKVGLNRPERSILLVGDNDPEGSTARRTLQKAAETIAATGREVRVTVPDGVNDCNDLLQTRTGKTDVRLLVEAALDGSPLEGPKKAEPTYKDTGIKLAVAEKRVEEVVVEFFKVTEPVVWGFQTAPATGKTEYVLQNIAERWQKKAERARAAGVYAVPEHKLSADIARRLDKETEPGVSGVWYGAMQPDPQTPGCFMCRFAVEGRLALVLQAGGKVESLCGEGDDACKFRDCCGYHRQRRERPLVRIVPNCMLGEARPEEIPAGAFLILDEGFRLIQGDGPIPYSVPIEDLLLGARSFRDGEDSVDARASKVIRNKVMTALAECGDGRLKRGAFDRAGFSSENAAAMPSLEWQSHNNKLEGGATTLRSAPIQELKTSLQQAGATLRIVKQRVCFWHRLEAWLKGDQPESVEIERHGQELRLTWRQEIHESWRTVPTLHMDATLETEIVKAWLPDIKIKDPIDVEPDPAAVTITQIMFSASARKMISGEKASLKDQTTARNNRQKLVWIIEELAERYRGQGKGKWDGLVIAQLELVRLIKAEFAEELKRWGGRIAFEHYNAIRGVDVYKDVRFQVDVGRTEAPVRTAEKTASVILGRMVEELPEPPPGQRLWYPLVEGGIRMRKGPAHPTMVERHPDPGVEAVRKSIAEAELVQALGRCRANQRKPENPVEVVLVTTKPLPVTVDRVLSWDEAVPSPLALTAARGVVSLSWGGWAAVLRDRFESPEAGRRYFGHHPLELRFLRTLKSGHSPLDRTWTGKGENSQEEFARFLKRWIRVRVRRSTGYSAEFLVRSDLDAQAHLTRLFGELTKFEVIVELDLRPAVDPPGPGEVCQRGKRIEALLPIEVVAALEAARQIVPPALTAQSVDFNPADLRTTSSTSMYTSRGQD